MHETRRRNRGGIRPPWTAHWQPALPERERRKSGCSMRRRWRQSGAARLVDRNIEPDHPRRRPCRAFGKPARADAVPGSRTHRSRPDQVGRWRLEGPGQRERAVHGLVGQKVDGGAGRRTDISRSLKLRGGRLTSKIFRVASPQRRRFHSTCLCRKPVDTLGSHGDRTVRAG